ncbi:unnamed protein product, partial [Amoebophrya sp. A25]
YSVVFVPFVLAATEASSSLKGEHENDDAKAASRPRTARPFLRSVCAALYSAEFCRPLPRDHLDQRRDIYTGSPQVLLRERLLQLLLGTSDKKDQEQEKGEAQEWSISRPSISLRLRLFDHWQLGRTVDLRKPRVPFPHGQIRNHTSHAQQTNEDVDHEEKELVFFQERDYPRSFARKFP